MVSGGFFFGGLLWFIPGLRPRQRLKVGSLMEYGISGDIGPGFWFESRH